MTQWKNSICRFQIRCIVFTASFKYKTCLIILIAHEKWHFFPIKPLQGYSKITVQLPNLTMWNYISFSGSIFMGIILKKIYSLGNQLFRIRKVQIGIKLWEFKSQNSFLYISVHPYLVTILFIASIERQ